MGTLVDNGGCYFNGEIILPLPEVMAMKDELADLRAFKATTTPQLLPALLTLANGLACNKTRCPQLRASGELPAVSTTSNSGEKGRGAVRELSVSNRAGQEIFINTMSVARSQARAPSARSLTTMTSGAGTSPRTSLRRQPR